LAKVPTLQVPDAELKPTKVNPETAAFLGKEVVDLGEGISSLGQHMTKIQGMTDVRNALTGLNEDTNNIHNQISKETDLVNAPQKADDLLQKALDDRASKITDSEARDRFLDRGSAIISRTNTSINSMINGKQLQASKQSLTNYGDTFKSVFSQLTRPDQMQAAIDDFSREVDLQQNMTGMSPFLSDQYKKQTIGQARVEQIDNDLNIPGMAPTVNKRLKDPNDPMYKGLDPSVREKKIKDSEFAMKRQDAEQKEALTKVRSNNGHYLVQLDGQKRLTPQTVEEFGYTGRISQKEFDSWTKKHQSDIIHGNTDGETYTKAWQFMANPENSIDATRQHLLSAYADNKLSKEDFQDLYEMHLRPLANGDWQSLRNVYGKDQEEKDTMSRNKGFLGAAYSIIEKYSPKQAKSMLSNFIVRSKSSTPEDYPRIANDVVKTQRLMDNPEIATYPEEGVTTQDENGNRANQTPDGSVQPEDQGSTDSLDASY